ncbi:hypothetical protein ABE494_21530 [Stenotrophomonas lactitubi]|uniref:hypothetical protein n=1 Tax=Stenotrophomonas lactitubi TaxID=2045214 RepID=UPI003207A698
MAQKIIDLTTQHPSWVGDLFPVAFGKCNDNFTELFAATAGLPAMGGRNMLINCSIPINQRGFAGGALAAGVYGYDRWKAGAGGCNVTINATTGVFTHTSGPLQQIVEAPPLAWGQPLTISVENPSGSIAVSVGGATATITAGSGRRGVTVTPSGSGNMTVQLTATGVTYSRPQLERGSAATPFDVRWYALELLLCQRYYEKSYNDTVKPGTAGAGDGRCTVLVTGLPATAHIWGQSVDFRVSKRANPSITTYSHATGAVGMARDSSVNGDVPTAISAPGQAGFLWYASAAGSPASVNLECHWVADAEL